MFGSLFKHDRKTILLAWELGAGLGHIHRLLTVATQLESRGSRLVFVLRSKQHVAPIVAHWPQAVILQAPFWRKDPAAPPIQKGFASNYADVLLRCGYQSRETLMPLVLAWRRIFAEVKPNLIIGDHSPTAVLAAGQSIPVVHVGSGFATPPRDRPLLTLHAKSAQGDKAREAQVLASIREVQTVLGLSLSGTVPGLFDAAENFTCCLPELDPYRRVRTTPAVGPLKALPGPQPPPSEARLFGYLAAEDKRLPMVLQSLVRSKIPASLFIRGLTAEVARTTEGSSVELFDRPQDLPAALATSAAILHHGGLSTTEAALAIGRPQFLLPRYLEQALTADAVEKLKCGVNLAREKSDLGEIVRSRLKTPSYQSHASTIATRLSQRPKIDTLELVATACLKHLD